MTVNFINVLFNNLRCNITRLHLKSGLQIRTIAAMEVATVEEDSKKILNKNETRYRRRFMKRQWEDVRKDENEPHDKNVCRENVERIKRKKVAMLLSYCGVNYFGMQRNPGVPTIEEELLKALKDAKYITEADFENQESMQFQRSSRTDKGVSASRQVVSLKMPLEYSIEEINKRLPECIRVFGIKRVTNKFNSKGKCDARTYSYTLPTYVFEPSLKTSKDKIAYRITKEKQDHVNEVLSIYKGTKCYHNFTAKKSFTDPSTNRYMLGFAIDRIFVDNDMEFAVLLVKGQSFMLHQIRKMVGLTIAVVRGHAESSILEKVFTKEKVMLPTAPGLGLVLNMVHYDRYNKKFKDTHDILIWEDENEAVEKFTREFIYPNIVAGEVNEDSMGLWLEKIQQHSYEPQDEEEDMIQINENKKDVDTNSIGEVEESSDSKDIDTNSLEKVEESRHSKDVNRVQETVESNNKKTIEENSELKDADINQESADLKDTDKQKEDGEKDAKDL